MHKHHLLRESQFFQVQNLKFMGEMLDDAFENLSLRVCWIKSESQNCGYVHDETKNRVDESIFQRFGVYISLNTDSGWTCTHTDSSSSHSRHSDQERLDYVMEYFLSFHLFKKVWGE